MSTSSKGWTEYVYLLNFDHMAYLSWLTPRGGSYSYIFVAVEAMDLVNVIIRQIIYFIDSFKSTIVTLSRAYKAHLSAPGHNLIIF